MPAIADQAVQDLFKNHFGFRPAHVARAPAKVELLGSHADYNEGLVLTVAADRYAFVVVNETGATQPYEFFLQECTAPPVLQEKAALPWR